MSHLRTTTRGLTVLVRASVRVVRLSTKATHCAPWLSVELPFVLTPGRWTAPGCRSLPRRVIRPHLPSCKRGEYSSEPGVRTVPCP